ncbi:MAG: transglutaminase family protein [Candidatus Rokubacteria bacterium]|nr:transglutaminase family protein [Candidatus Rokubacteria bacterium]MBI4627844.1 transglutaminase family protein [Candidatus Rokubacteria bacterium]
MASGEFIDSADADVRAFAREATAGAGDALAGALKLYDAVRDGVPYDPYYVGEARAYFRASDCLRAHRGFCVPKAALLAAVARAAGIPARVGYADVRNHLTTRKLSELVGGDLFVWHGYAELYLNSRWVKATPAFNLALCERFGVRPLEFDGRRDSLFHEYDRAGRRHMEYVRDHGHYPDVPYDTILAAFRTTHPRWLALGAGGDRGDFAREATGGG